MKNFKFLLIACFAFLLASCGGKKGNSDEAIKLTPETTHIKGELGDYFEVVDKEYTVTTNDLGDLVSIEVKRTDVDYAFDIKGVEPYGYSGRGVNGHAGFGIEILDENGNVIEKSAATTGGIGGMYSSDDMKEALKLRADETGTVRWLFHFDTNKKPAKFRLTSAYEIDITSDFEDLSMTMYQVLHLMTTILMTISTQTRRQPLPVHRIGMPCLILTNSMLTSASLT